MKIIQKIIEYTYKIAGCILMILVLFYLNFYEFKPLYQPKSN